MKQFLINLMSSDNAISTTRFLSLAVVLNVLIIWSAVCIKKMEIADIPWGVIALIGLALTGKVVQKFTESDEQVKK